MTLVQLDKHGNEAQRLTVSEPYISSISIGEPRAHDALVVIAIIPILAAILFPVFAEAAKNTQ